MFRYNIPFIHHTLDIPINVKVFLDDQGKEQADLSISNWITIRYSILTDETVQSTRFLRNETQTEKGKPIMGFELVVAQDSAGHKIGKLHAMTIRDERLETMLECSDGTEK